MIRCRPGIPDARQPRVKAAYIVCSTAKGEIALPARRHGATDHAPAGFIGLLADGEDIIAVSTDAPRGQYIATGAIAETSPTGPAGVLRTRSAPSDAARREAAESADLRTRLGTRHRWAANASAIFIGRCRCTTPCCSRTRCQTIGEGPIVNVAAGSHHEARDVPPQPPARIPVASAAHRYDLSAFIIDLPRKLQAEKGLPSRMTGTRAFFTGRCLQAALKSPPDRDRLSETINA